MKRRKAYIVQYIDSSSFLHSYAVLYRLLSPPGILGSIFLTPIVSIPIPTTPIQTQKGLARASELCIRRFRPKG